MKNLNQKLSEFKVGQRVRANGEEPEGTVTHVPEFRAGAIQEVNVIWDGHITPMPCTIANLEIIAGAVAPGSGGDDPDDF